MRQYSSIILFVIAVFLSCRSDAVNETKFVNTTRSRLKILGVFGHLGKSHFDVFQPLVEELARRGHELTIISHFPRSENAKAKEPLPNYKDISLVDEKLGVYVNIIDLNLIQHDIFHFIRELLFLRYMADSACSIGLQNPAIKEFLRSDEKFDLIITESFNTDCFLGFAHRFKAPYMGLSSCQILPWVNEDFGNEDNPSYIPSIYVGLTRPIHFFGRLWNSVSLSVVKLAYDYWYRPRDQIFANEAFGPDLPELSTIARQSQALLVNTHSSLHGSKPQLPNVVEIGGLHIPSKVNPLPSDIAKFLDSAHEGVLYFNFGSMIKATTMPREKLDAILTVLGSIPRKVLWKWESDELPRKLDNVMAKKWLPQFDVMSK